MHAKCQLAILGVWLVAVSTVLAQHYPTVEFKPGDKITIMFFLSEDAGPAGEEIPAALSLTVKPDGTIDMPFGRLKKVTGEDASQVLRRIEVDVRLALWFVKVRVKTMASLDRGKREGKYLVFSDHLDLREAKYDRTGGLGDHWVPGEHEKEMKRRFPAWYENSLEPSKPFGN